MAGKKAAPSAAHPEGFEAKLVPGELELWLSNRCNLKCGYCYLVNYRTSPEVLTFGQAARGIDLYLGYTGLAASPSEHRRVVLLGGEPLLHYRLVQRIVSYVRRKAGPGMGINLVTNGTLLDQRKAEYLTGRGVSLQVSLDGSAPSNDRNRGYAGGRGGSVFAKVSERLRGLSPRVKRQIGIEYTITAATAGSLVPDLEALLAIGAGEVWLDVEMLDSWDRAGLDALRAGLRDFRSFYAAGLRFRGGGALAGFRLKRIRERDLGCVTDELVLAPDGKFYPCSIVAAHQESRERYCVGDLSSGVDFRRMKSVLGEVGGYMGDRDCLACAQCPVGRYFDCRLKGKDPEADFENLRSVTSVFREETSGVLEAERVMNEMRRRKDGDFNCRRTGSPSAPMQVSSLEMEVEAGGRQAALRDLRAGADLLIGSPGSGKRLVLRGGDPAACADAMEGLALYSLLKARELGKGLLVIAETPAADWPGRGRFEEFCREHGVLRLLRAGPGGECAAGAACSLEIAPGTSGAIRGRLLRAAASRTSGLLLWPSRDGWTAPALRRLELGLAGAEAALRGRLPALLARAGLYPGPGAQSCPFSGGLRLSASGEYLLPGGASAGAAGGGLRGEYAACPGFPDPVSCRGCLRLAASGSGFLYALKAAEIVDGLADRLRGRGRRVPPSGLFSGARMPKIGAIRAV